jgi:hypothetical protein
MGISKYSKSSFALQGWRKCGSEYGTRAVSLREKAGMRGLKSIIYNPHPSPLPEGEGIFRDSLMMPFSL